jgi:PST family polysaccharide transporter
VIAFLNRHAVVLESLFSLSLLRLLEQIVPLLVFPYVVSVVGAEKYGVIATAQALIFLFVIIVNYGFDVTCVRDVALNRDNPDHLNQLVGSIYLAKLALMIFATVLFGAIIMLSRQYAAEQTVFIGAFLMVISSWILPVWFFQGMEKMKFIALMSVTRNVLYVVLVFVLISQSADYWKVTYIQSICAILGGAVGFWVMCVRHRIRPAVSAAAIKKQLVEGFPIFLNMIGAMTIQRLPVILISRYYGFEGAGLFAVAHKVIEIGRAAENIVVQVFYPRFAKLAQINRQHYFRQWCRVSLILVGMGLGLWLGLALISPHVFRAFGMDGVMESLPIVNLYGFNLVLAAFISASGLLSLMVMGEGRAMAKSQIIPLVLSIALGIPVIRYFGLTPYVYSLLFVNGCFILIRFVILKRLGFFQYGAELSGSHS